MSELWLSTFGRCYTMSLLQIRCCCIWVKGDGVIVQMQCIGIAFSENVELQQGWIRGAILGKSSLDGFYAILPKQKVKKMLRRIHKEIITRGSK